jgi:hypothetical protein
MTWFADLTPCDYFSGGPAANLEAVGWLESGQPFPTGIVERAVYDKLVTLLKSPWQPVVTMGVHHCDLCTYGGPAGSSNLFVPAGPRIFVCPELIVHYMNAHGYLPPSEFCHAVTACPPMRSMSYLKALRAAGISLKSE